MNKYLLLSLIFIGAVIFSFLFSRSHITQKETANGNNPKYLCDTAVADCSKNIRRVPKGVCIPGGKCT